MSYGILREAMKNYLKAINLLNETGKKELEKEVQKIVNKLPAYQIGSKGQLLEWEEEFEEVQPNHRHISHLYSLYPGSDINWRDEILSQAVQRSMEMRGDEGTGWSLAWKTAIWAHLGKGDKAAKLLARFMKVSLERDPNKSNEGGGGICPNLLCTCPPMQIDGNFGITAAITEMLIQSEEEEIRLLPALPDDWKEGRVTGIGTRCQCFVDFSWKADGEGKKNIKLVVYSSVPQRIRLWIGNQKEALDLLEGRNNHEFWL
jgi:alpha-L-fucosidase 2